MNTTQQRPEEDRTCNECKRVFESMDRLVDHLTDEHDAFTDATLFGANSEEILDDVQLNISLTATPDK